MTRVARARQRVLGGQTEATAVSRDRMPREVPRPEADFELANGIVAEEPWDIEEPSFEPPPETAAGEQSDADIGRLESDARGHLAGVVRRVFLAPPVGIGARTVLFGTVDAEGDESRTGQQVALLLADLQPGKTVCVVDTEGELHLRSGTGQGVVRSPVGPDAVRAGERNAGRWLRDLCARFDYVVIEARATDEGGSANVMASMVDGVILLVDERATRREAARGAADVLQAAGARLLGVVLTNRTYPIPGSVYRRL